MPRKRRQPKRRAPIPRGLAEITLSERAYWSCHGPAIGDRPWPDWATWLDFYGSIRDQLFAARPWLRERSIADAVYVAWREGRDPGAVRDELCAARPDLRRVLWAQMRGDGHAA